MELLCAQPDKPLFIWQLQVLITSLQKLRVRKERIHFLFLLEQGRSPSAEALALGLYATLHFYAERPGGRLYAASSKPYLFARFMEQDPTRVQRPYLFIESDMLVYRLPDVEHRPGVWYWSDASRYLESGVNERQFGFEPAEAPAFGFHAYGAGADAAFWYRVEADAQRIYAGLVQRPGVNAWISEMRAWMWNASSRFENQVHPELTFNDGRGVRKPGAALYHQLSTKLFRKREFSGGFPDGPLPVIDPAFCQADYLAAIEDARIFFKIKNNP